PAQRVRCNAGSRVVAQPQSPGELRECTRHRAPYTTGPHLGEPPTRNDSGIFAIGAVIQGDTDVVAVDAINSDHDRLVRVQPGQLDRGGWLAAPSLMKTGRGPGNVRESPARFAAHAIDAQKVYRPIEEWRGFHGLKPRIL